MKPVLLIDLSKRGEYLSYSRNLTASLDRIVASILKASAFSLRMLILLLSTHHVPGYAFHFKTSGGCFGPQPPWRQFLWSQGHECYRISLSALKLFPPILRPLKLLPKWKSAFIQRPWNTSYCNNGKVGFKAVSSKSFMILWRRRKRRRSPSPLVVAARKSWAGLELTFPWQWCGILLRAFLCNNIPYSLFYNCTTFYFCVDLFICHKSYWAHFF